MSVCTFIASEFPLKEVQPSPDCPDDIINIDDYGKITICGGGADDNYYLSPFTSFGSYTDKKYGVWLQWTYTEGRAKQIIEYIKNALRNTLTIELWHVWLGDLYYEWEDGPVIHRKTISIDELTPKHIKEIDDAEIWGTSGRMYPNRPFYCNRPSFYCLEIKQS